MGIFYKKPIILIYIIQSIMAKRTTSDDTILRIVDSIPYEHYDVSVVGSAVRHAQQSTSRPDLKPGDYYQLSFKKFVAPVTNHGKAVYFPNDNVVKTKLVYSTGTAAEQALFAAITDALSKPEGLKTTVTKQDEKGNDVKDTELPFTISAKILNANCEEYKRQVRKDGKWIYDIDTLTSQPRTTKSFGIFVFPGDNVLEVYDREWSRQVEKHLLVPEAAGESTEPVDDVPATK